MARIDPIVLSLKDIPSTIIKVEVIKAIDITAGGTTAVVNPSVAWERSTDASGPIIKVTDIGGLDPERKYRLTFLLSA